MPRVTFYSHFTRFTRGEKEAKVDADDVRQTIGRLVERYGEEFRGKFVKENGELREFVRIFLNDKDVRFIGNLDAKTGEDDEVLVVPAVAGG
jgi:molybdopterin converting factor small subunit